MKKLNSFVKYLLIILIFISGRSAVYSQPEAGEDEASADNGVELRKVVITGTRTEKILKDSPVRTEVLNKERIEQSSAKNLYEIFDKGLMPGVAVNTSCTNCNFSEVRMQGLEGGYSLILFDGLPVFSALAGVYGLRQINPVNIERIEVVKGASSALYGSSALGGVINIITKEPVKGDPIVSASYTGGVYDQTSGHNRSAYNADAVVGIREGDVGFILTGSKHHNDYVKTNDDDYTDKVEQESHSLNAKAHIYFLNDTRRLTLVGRSIYEFRRGGYAGLKSRMIDTDDDGIPDTEVSYNAIDDPLDEDAEHITTNRYEWGAGYRAEFCAGGILNLNWIMTNHERDATNGARPFHSGENSSLADVLYTQPVLGNNIVVLGGNYKQEELGQVINYEKDEKRESKIAAALFQDEWEAFDGLDLVVGVRYDDVFESSLKEDRAVTPRAALKYGISENFVLRASYGWGFKVPTLFAEDLHLCSAAPTVDVPDDLESERSTSINGGISWYGERLTCDLNLFRTDIEDKINLVFVEGRDYDAVYKNAGKARTQGMELSASYRLLDSLTFHAAYTYTQAQFGNRQLEPGDDGYEDSDNLLRVPDMTASLNLEYKDKKYGITAAAGGRYTGRQYVQRDMLIYEDGDQAVADGSADAGDEVSGDPVPHIDHTDGYFVFDAKITKDFRYGRWTYSIFAGCDNITDEVQETIYSAEEEDSAAYIYAPMTGRYIYAGAKIGL